MPQGDEVVDDPAGCGAVVAADVADRDARYLAVSDVDERVAVGGEPGEVVAVRAVAEDQAGGGLAEAVDIVAVDAAHPALVAGGGE